MHEAVGHGVAGIIGECGGRNVRNCHVYVIRVGDKLQCRSPTTTNAQCTNASGGPKPAVVQSTSPQHSTPRVRLPEQQ